MDAIDNLIYATLNDSFFPNGSIARGIVGQTDIGAASTNPNQFRNNVSSYDQGTRYNFTIVDDTSIIEAGIRKHWFDIANQVSYTNKKGYPDATGTSVPMYNGANPPNQPDHAYVKFNTPPYHLIFAYLVENTRIAQIFERLIWMYLHDEKLTKAEPAAFRWIMNTEDLFYKDAPPSARRGISSQLRPVSEASRRNAYQRMFGMDLAFGDLNNAPYQYVKADANNASFITVFETFLVEIWKGYTNANNTSGQNTTDTEHIEDLGRRLQEMLMSRRTTDLTFNNYRYFNLSAEEYSSNIFMYWLFYVVSYNSPVVDYLNCKGNTAGERLINIGRRVGLPAHTKSIALLDIAQPMSGILRFIELGVFNNSNFIERVMRAQSTINPIPAPKQVETALLTDLLLIINNWEKATGHRIKNPETNITGTVRIDQRPKGVPVLN